MPCACSVTVPGRSPSVLMVPGAPPLTSTPPTAPPGASTTVHPVRPCASVQCPTDTPAGSRAFASCCALTVASRHGRPSSENRQVAVQFKRGDLMTIVPPFFPLVAQEEVEDVLAERLGHQLAVLHHVQRLVQALRQRLDAEDAALALGERPHVVLGLWRQLVPGLDALEAGRQDRGQRQIRVAG